MTTVYTVLTHLEHDGKSYPAGSLIELAGGPELRHHRPGEDHDRRYPADAVSLLEAGVIIERDSPLARAALDGATAAETRAGFAHEHHGHGVTAAARDDLDHRVLRGQHAIRQAAERRAHA